MTVFKSSSTPIVHPPRPSRLIVGLALAALIPVGFAAASTANAADPAIDLGTAKAFSVLAGSGVTNTGVTKMSGSLGTYATTTVTTDTPFVFTGAAATNHAGDGVTQQAKSDLLTAYNAVAGALPPTAVPEELTRKDPYLPGIYRASSSMVLSGAMTLDGGGRSDGVFIFQAPTSTLTTASNATVLFVNGAQPCNVYWQVGSSATFGTGTTFVGNVLAHTSITANTNAKFEGRLLANNGAVTLDSNTFTNPACDTSGGSGGSGSGGSGGSGSGGSGSGGSGGSGSGGSGSGGSGGSGSGGSGSGGSGGSGSGGSSGGGTSGSGSTATTTNAAVDSASGTTDADSTLPDTGGPPIELFILALTALAGGTLLVRSQRSRGIHRA